jgi:hypothetical protein
MDQIDLQENRRRMAAGELYHAFAFDLQADRKRCKTAYKAFNEAAGDTSRRRLVELYKE